jgi:inorganic pyrophosphatase
VADLTGEQPKMMLHTLDPGPQFPEVVRMVVEIPKNSVNKYEYDRSLGVFRLDRTLYSPMHYPGDYGFIPGTVAEDGDPLDVLILTDEATFPGCIQDVRPIGILDMRDRSVLDTKIFAVPSRNPRYNETHAVDQISPHARIEIEHFFNYKLLEAKGTETRGWKGPKEARQAIRESRDRYLQRGLTG